jgi:hypothetical protein
MNSMLALIARGDKKELSSFSQQHIPKHAFRDADFGCNPHGIFGATPNDVLHGLKSGIIPYLLEICLDDNLNNSG